MPPVSSQHTRATALLTPCPQRFQTLPPAQTAAARDALKSFYCDLCQKGYTRMNEYEAHLSSYDHSHKQRMKDMKAMVRDPNAVARARKQEAKADGVISIKLGDAAGGPAAAGGSGAGPGGGFKKGGFKKAGFKSAFTAVGDDAPAAKDDKDAAGAGDAGPKPAARRELVESDTDDEGYEVYDPRFPTD